MASVVTSAYARLGINSECLAAFGGIIAAYWGLKFLLSLWDGAKAFIFGRSLGLSANLKKMGEWAGECTGTCALLISVTSHQVTAVELLLECFS